jgi:hypothetical protein
VLTGGNAEIPERVLLLWPEEILGPVRDKLVVLDSKEIRHAHLVSVNAVSATDRRLGSSKVKECRKINPRSRATTRKFQKRFLHRNGGPERLLALTFCKFPAAWRLLRQMRRHTALLRRTKTGEGKQVAAKDRLN